MWSGDRRLHFAVVVSFVGGCLGVFLIFLLRDWKIRSVLGDDLGVPPPAPDPPIIKARRDAYAFLAVNDSPLLGILTSSQALITYGSTKQRVVLCTPAVSVFFRDVMRMMNNTIIDIPPPPTHPNYQPGIAAWKLLLSKLEVYKLYTMFDKIVYLDADMVLNTNIDDLFETEQQFISMTDNYSCHIKPGKINSGLVAITMNSSWYSGMMEMLNHTVIKDGDQELVQKYMDSQFGNLTLLPETYAAFVWRCVCHIKYNFSEVKVIHFTNWQIQYWKLAQSDPRAFAALRGFNCSAQYYVNWRNHYNEAIKTLKHSLNLTNTSESTQIHLPLLPQW
ncbi:hypothetical protein Pelo_10712 [Pelomyxa schiedti]|nr:hypothetical protein Pelo_10711 [Pelomyxa schiedti]KAH3757487.1 hypothetical protein Pelo_10712 [Pelomyxa schiedti]